MVLSICDNALVALVYQRTSSSTFWIYSSEDCVCFSTKQCGSVLSIDVPFSPDNISMIRRMPICSSCSELCEWNNCSERARKGMNYIDTNSQYILICFDLRSSWFIPYPENTTKALPDCSTIQFGEKNLLFKSFENGR